jgi:hypothetical protein
MSASETINMTQVAKKERQYQFERHRRAPLYFPNKHFFPPEEMRHKNINFVHASILGLWRLIQYLDNPVVLPHRLLFCGREGWNNYNEKYGITPLNTTSEV